MSPVRVFIKFVLQKLVLEHEQALYFRGFLPHPYPSLPSRKLYADLCHFCRIFFRCTILIICVIELSK